MDTLSELIKNEADREWLSKELYRRAAEQFELCDNPKEAAECWAEAGESGKASAIYLRLGDHTHAAPLLLTEGRYEEALMCYRQWLSGLPGTSAESRIRALLGISASLTYLEREEEAAWEAYTEARNMIGAEHARKSGISGRCWEALGEYGAVVCRWDLVNVGYERALRCCGESDKEERIRIAKKYLSSVTENRLLTADLRKRIAKWKAAAEEKPEPKFPRRSEALTVSGEDAEKVFGLKKERHAFGFDIWKPTEFVANEYEDSGETVADHATGLMWQKSGSDDWLTYEQAEAYVESLNRERFAGYADWRLPTVDELTSLLEPEKQSNNLYISPIFGGEKSGLDWYWTSDRYSGGGAWSVYFGSGYVDWYDLSYNDYVRVCRSRQ